MQELLGADMRNVKGQVPTSESSSRQPARKLFLDTTLTDSKSTEASTSLSLDELGAVDSPCGSSTSRPIEVTEILLLLILNILWTKGRTIGCKTKSCKLGWTPYCRNATSLFGWISCISSFILPCFVFTLISNMILVSLATLLDQASNALTVWCMRQIHLLFDRFNCTQYFLFTRNINMKKEITKISTNLKFWTDSFNEWGQC